jgi:hypothetical protein
MLTAIRRAREEGLEWWTGRQINAWERARRAVTLTGFDKTTITLNSENELADATVLLSGPTASGGGSLQAWGARFRAATKTIRGATQFELEKL